MPVLQDILARSLEDPLRRAEDTLGRKKKEIRGELGSIAEQFRAGAIAESPLARALLMQQAQVPTQAPGLSPLQQSFQSLAFEQPQFRLPDVPQATGGGGGGLSIPFQELLRQALPEGLNAPFPDLNVAAGPDFSAARAALEGARPGAAEQSTRLDQALAFLSGAAGGSLQGGSLPRVGSVLAGAGAGALGGLGAVRGQDRAARERQGGELRQHQRALAQFETGVATAQAGAAQRLAEAQNERDMVEWQQRQVMLNSMRPQVQGLTNGNLLVKEVQNGQDVVSLVNLKGPLELALAKFGAAVKMAEVDQDLKGELLKGALSKIGDDFGAEAEFLAGVVGQENPAVGNAAANAYTILAGGAGAEGEALMVRATQEVFNVEPEEARKLLNGDLLISAGTRADSVTTVRTMIADRLTGMLMEFGPGGEATNAGAVVEATEERQRRSFGTPPGTRRAEDTRPRGLGTSALQRAIGGL